MSDDPPVTGRLLRTVTPFQGEDVRSVAMRYAALKRLTVTRLLHSGLRMDRCHLTSLPLKRDGIEALAELAGLDADVLQADTLGSLYGRSAGDGMVVPHWRRIAPGMMRSDPEPWIRAHWQLACVPCDPDTGECLLHICPGCRNTLSWSQAEIPYLCQSCGFDLRQVEPRTAPSAVKDLARLMEGIVRRRPDGLARLPRTVAKASLEEQIAFFVFLGTLRALVAGTIQRPGGFAAFRGLELALSYPASLRDLAGELLAANEERDERIGRFVATMEIVRLARGTLVGKLKISVCDLVDRMLKDNFISCIKVVEARTDRYGSIYLKLDRRLFLTTGRTTPERGRSLSGLGDRPILPASLSPRPSPVRRGCA